MAGRTELGQQVKGQMIPFPGWGYQHNIHILNRDGVCLQTTMRGKLPGKYPSPVGLHISLFLTEGCDRIIRNIHRCLDTSKPIHGFYRVDDRTYIAVIVPDGQAVVRIYQSVTSPLPAAAAAAAAAAKQLFTVAGVNVALAG